MFQYQQEEYQIDAKWSSSEAYLEIINSSQNTKELLSAPFLLKMFVEAIPLINEKSKIEILDIYEKFEEHSFDRELRTEIVNGI